MSEGSMSREKMWELTVIDLVGDMTAWDDRGMYGCRRFHCWRAPVKASATSSHVSYVVGLKRREWRRAS